MPRFSGLKQRSRSSSPRRAVLLIPTVGEEVAVESIKAGAADYLMKQNLIRFVRPSPGPSGTRPNGGPCGGPRPCFGSNGRSWG